MENIYTVSNDYTITLPFELRKRLGDPSAYNKKGARELHLFWVRKGNKTYVVIHTSINFTDSPGYAFTSSIQDGVVTLPKNFLYELRPGQQLHFDGVIYPRTPIWLELL